MPEKDFEKDQIVFVKGLDSFIDNSVKYNNLGIEFLYENDTFDFFQILNEISLIFRNKNASCDSCDDKIIINGYHFPLQNLSQFPNRNKQITFVPLESYLFTFNNNKLLMIGLEDDYSGVRKFNSFNLIFNISNRNEPKIIYANWSYNEGLMERIGILDSKLSLLEYQFNDTIKVFNFNGENFIEMKQKWIYGKMNEDNNFVINKLRSNWKF